MNPNPEGWFIVNATGRSHYVVGARTLCGVKWRQVYEPPLISSLRKRRCPTCVKYEPERTRQTRLGDYTAIERQRAERGER